jgi:hypothetical protein
MSMLLLRYPVVVMMSSFCSYLEVPKVAVAISDPCIFFLRIGSGMLFFVIPGLDPGSPY